MRRPFRSTIKDDPMPAFSARQIEALEKRFPVRLPALGEDPQRFERYVGAAELVQWLKAECMALGEDDGNGGVTITDEALDREAEEIAKGMFPK